MLSIIIIIIIIIIIVTAIIISIIIVVIVIVINIIITIRATVTSYCLQLCHQSASSESFAPFENGLVHVFPRSAQNSACSLAKPLITLFLMFNNEICRLYAFMPHTLIHASAYVYIYKLYI